jgi:hypothetical protein
MRGAGHCAVTVTVTVPVCPSHVAVMVTVPTATPVTTPDAGSTVAIAGSLLVHVTVRPLSAFPCASRGTAVAWVVPPTAMVALPIDTLTLATGTGVTVTAAVPLTPSLVAVIVTEPGATPVTTPVPASTVATAVFDELHVTVRPPSGLPCASRGSAVNPTV